MKNVMFTLTTITLGLGTIGCGKDKKKKVYVENPAVQKELDETKVKLADANADVASKTEEIKNLKASVAAATKFKSDLEAQKADLETKIGKLEATLKQPLTPEEKKVLEKELETAKSDLDSVTSSLKTTDESLEASVKELEAAKAELESVKTQRDELAVSQNDLLEFFRDSARVLLDFMADRDIGTFEAAKEPINEKVGELELISAAATETASAKAEAIEASQKSHADAVAHLEAVSGELKDLLVYLEAQDLTPEDDELKKALDLYFSEVAEQETEQKKLDSEEDTLNNLNAAAKVSQETLKANQDALVDLEKQLEKIDSKIPLDVDAQITKNNEITAHKRAIASNIKDLTAKDAAVAAQVTVRNTQQTAVNTHSGVTEAALVAVETKTGSEESVVSRAKAAEAKATKDLEAANSASKKADDAEASAKAEVVKYKKVAKLLEVLSPADSEIAVTPT